MILTEIKKRDKDLIQKFNERVAHITSQTAGILNESPKDKAKRIYTLLGDYRAFCTYYFPHYCSAPAADFHIQLAEEVRNNARCLLVKMWPRAHAKSTNACILIPIWLMLMGKLKYMVLASQSADSAKGLLTDLQAELTANQKLIQDFGEFENFGTWELGEFTTKGGIKFKSIGRGQSPRGLRNKQHRPDYIVCDDIDDDKTCNNPMLVQKAYDWCFSALYGTFSPKTGRMVFVANLINKVSILQKAADNPESIVQIVPAWDENKKPAWHQNYTTADLELKLKTMGYRLFEKEYMHHPVVEGSIYKLNDFQFAPPPKLQEFSYIVCYTDPSWRSGTKSDYKATVVVGKTPKGIFWILKAYVQQTTAQRMVEWHYEIKEWAGDGVNIYYYMEANFMQADLLKEFDVLGEKKGYRVPIQGDTRQKGDKFQRIETMYGLFERRLVFVSEEERYKADMTKLVEQFLTFEKGSRAPDDGPDAVQGAISMLNIKAANANPPKFIKRGGSSKTF